MSEAGLPPFQRLDVLDDRRPRNAPLNMAVDEVLLGSLADNPLLRIYRWARPAVSYGYFTPWQPVAACYPRHDLVRRWTGGGVVEHGDDITFSLLIPRSHPLTNQPAGESYRVLHEALRAALLVLGWDATTLASEKDSPAGAAVRRCFASPVRYDLLSAGQKISGGAQRRTRHGLLHQGSLRAPSGEPLAAEDFLEALPAAFASKWAPRSLRAPEEAMAERLAVDKYAGQPWLRRV